MSDTNDDTPDPRAGLGGRSDASSDEILELYDSWAASGDYDRDVSEWGYEAPERVADLAVAALAKTPGEVLDAGCGTGLAGSALRERVGDDQEILGGDFTPSSVEAARSLGSYSAVQHLDLNAPLDYDDARFAVTVSVGVFSYLTDTEATIRELLRITRPGGSVIFTQRTDLWAERDCATLIERLVDAGECTATISEPMPYLPGHPDFGDAIGIRYVTLGS